MKRIIAMALNLLDCATGKRPYDVICCARCGRNHEALRFKSLRRPIEDADGTVWTAFAPCPTNGDPVLLRELP